MQMAIDDTTHNIFVTDTFDPILVFNKDGNYLYDVPIHRRSTRSGWCPPDHFSLGSIQIVWSSTVWPDHFSVRCDAPAISLGSVGIALTSDIIYASSQNCLLKVDKSNKCIKTIRIGHPIWGIDIGTDTNIYGCQYSNNSIAVYDDNLTYQKRIKLFSYRL